MTNSFAKGTDFEMTTLCAKAAGLKVEKSPRGYEDVIVVAGAPYDPLNDDAQAMALVKKFGIQIVRLKILWQVTGMFGDGHGELSWKPISSEPREDLNRAIVECVAKMFELRGKRIE